MNYIILMEPEMGALARAEVLQETLNMVAQILQQQKAK